MHYKAYYTHGRVVSTCRNIYMERPEYALGGKVQRLVSQDPQEPQGFYPVTQVDKR